MLIDIPFEQLVPCLIRCCWPVFQGLWKSIWTPSCWNGSTCASIVASRSHTRGSWASTVIIIATLTHARSFTRRRLRGRTSASFAGPVTVNSRRWSRTSASTAGKRRSATAAARPSCTAAACASTGCIVWSRTNKKNNASLTSESRWFYGFIEFFFLFLIVRQLNVTFHWFLLSLARVYRKGLSLKIRTEDIPRNLWTITVRGSCESVIKNSLYSSRVSVSSTRLNVKIIKSYWTHLVPVLTPATRPPVVLVEFPLYRQGVSDWSVAIGRLRATLLHAGTFLLFSTRGPRAKRTLPAANYTAGA